MTLKDINNAAPATYHRTLASVGGFNQSNLNLKINGTTVDNTGAEGRRPVAVYNNSIASGAVTCVDVMGNTITYNIQAGVWLPIQIKSISSAGTTIASTDIILWY